MIRRFLNLLRADFRRSTKRAALARERRHHEWVERCRRHQESRTAHRAYVWAKAAELAAEMEGRG